MNGVTHGNGIRNGKNGTSGKQAYPLNATFEDVQATAQHLLAMTSLRPQIGVICGSGLGGLVDMLEEPREIRYDEVPHFPISTAPGHAGKLVFGKLKGKDCMCMQGRAHLYEGYTAAKVVFPVRVMKAMGVEILIATNAAGGLNENYKVGDIMIFKDHINLPGLTGNNPLLGPNDERFGPRFPPLSNAYDRELRKLGRSVADSLSYDFVHEGVYAVQTGPCFETVSECRMLRIMGADVTGMSTVPEVIAGRHCGLRCFAMTLVTNMCVDEYDSEDIADSEEVLETGKLRSKDCQNLISEMVRLINLEP